MNPWSTIAGDLLACGATRQNASLAYNLCENAVVHPSEPAWKMFYMVVFAALLDRNTPVSDTAAAKRLTALINDDLGAAMFDSDTRAQLSAELFGYDPDLLEFTVVRPLNAHARFEFES